MHVITHGGAGSAPDEPERRKAVLDEAADAGARERSPTESVVAALSVLERSPRFNAGVGGAIQSDGVVRTDAGLMTSGRDVGAACGMAGVRDAARVARLVMERTPHVLLGGEHAREFAAACGIDTDCDLLTTETRERWSRLDPPPGDDYDARLAWVRDRFGEASDPRAHDTVGAVAVGDRGMAAGTSTGGRWCALAGRVGDVPQIGSGFFCSPHGGASATGAGEDIARATLTRRAVDRLADGASPQRAADAAIETFETETDSTAGVIVANADGETAFSFNAEAMQVSVAADE